MHVGPIMVYAASRGACMRGSTISRYGCTEYSQSYCSGVRR